MEPANESVQEQVHPWRPSRGAFQAYRSTDPEQLRSGARPQPARDGAPIVVKLSEKIVKTYQNCKPSFNYSNVLTKPSTPASNGGLDNENSNLILTVNGVLINGETNHRFIIKKLLGEGTFGQVAGCWSDELNAFVAVKVIKNQLAYRRQAIVEISILNMLNGQYDLEDKHHIVRKLEHFMFKEHLCIVFEILGVNLYELLKLNNLRGISLNLIRSFTKQILSALLILRNANVIHCDLKPENILLTTRWESAELKVIDFGSACMENRTVYSYIQSRSYRSPEVVLGHQYTNAIDMWSLGCVAAELFLGIPLFTAESEFDLLQRMIKVLGGGPPDHILRNARNTSKYFKHMGTPSRLSDNTEGRASVYQFLTQEDYEMREKTKAKIGKHFFREDWSLEQIIKSYQTKKNMSLEDIQKEQQERLVLTDFLKGLLHFDPLKRWTPWQASQHPFVTHEPFTGSFEPPVEATRVPICQGRMIVDHNPVSGHWLGAGLSPQANLNVSYLGSPYFDGQSSSYVSSYDSAASYGGVGDGCFGPGTIGSYGDQIGYLNYPPSYSVIGISPETWNHMDQFSASQGLRPVNIGMSPSSTFTPMHVGVGSPAKFTPPSSYFHGLGNPTNFTPRGPHLHGIGSPTSFTAPNSYFQSSPGSSTSSPRRYVPPSPARSSGGGASALGKAALLGQLNKRPGWGSPGSGVIAHCGGQDALVENMNLTCHGAQQNFYPGSVETIPSSYTDGASSLGSPHGFHHDRSHKPMFGPVLNATETAELSIFPMGSLPTLMSKALSISTGGEHLPPSPDFVDDENYSEDLLFESYRGDAVAGSSTFLSPQGVSGGPQGVSGAQGLGLLIAEGANNGRTYGGNNTLQDGSMAFSAQALHRLVHRPLHHQWQHISPRRLGQQPTQILPQQQNFSTMSYRKDRR